MTAGGIGLAIATGVVALLMSAVLALVRVAARAAGPPPAGSGRRPQPVKRLPACALSRSSGAITKPSPSRGACFSSAATMLAAPTVSA